MTILNKGIMYLCAYLAKKLREKNAALTLNSLEQNEYGVPSKHWIGKDLNPITIYCKVCQTISNMFLITFYNTIFSLV
jgi:hypothetical protein